MRYAVAGVILALIVVGLAGVISYQVGSENGKTAGFTYGYAQGYAEAQAKYEEVAPPEVAEFAEAFCKLDTPTLLSLTAVEVREVFQSFIDDLKSDWECDEVKYLSTVNFENGAADHIYLFKLSDHYNWIVFHFDAEGKFVDLTY